MGESAIIERIRYSIEDESVFDGCCCAAEPVCNGVYPGYEFSGGEVLVS